MIISVPAILLPPPIATKSIFMVSSTSAGPIYLNVSESSLFGVFSTGFVYASFVGQSA